MSPGKNPSLAGGTTKPISKNTDVSAADLARFGRFGGQEGEAREFKLHGWSFHNFERALHAEDGRYRAAINCIRDVMVARGGLALVVPDAEARDLLLEICRRRILTLNGRPGSVADDMGKAGLATLETYRPDVRWMCRLPDAEPIASGCASLAIKHVLFDAETPYSPDGGASLRTYVGRFLWNRILEVLDPTSPPGTYSLDSVPEHKHQKPLPETPSIGARPPQAVRTLLIGISRGELLGLEELRQFSALSMKPNEVAAFKAVRRILEMDPAMFRDSLQDNVVRDANRDRDEQNVDDRQQLSPLAQIGAQLIEPNMTAVAKFAGRSNPTLFERQMIDTIVNAARRHQASHDYFLTILGQRAELADILETRVARALAPLIAERTLSRAEQALVDRIRGRLGVQRKLFFVVPASRLTDHFESL